MRTLIKQGYEKKIAAKKGKFVLTHDSEVPRIKKMKIEVSNQWRSEKF